MLNSPRPYRHIRAEWVQCAAKGERRTLVIQSSELYKAIDEDKTLLEELFMVAMSKRGLPVFLWLAQTYPPALPCVAKSIRTTHARRNENRAV